MTGDEEHFPLRQVLGSVLLLTAQWCIHICWHLCVSISLLNSLSKDKTADSSEGDCSRNLSPGPKGNWRRAGEGLFTKGYAVIGQGVMASNGEWERLD